MFTFRLNTVTLSDRIVSRGNKSQGLTTLFMKHFQEMFANFSLPIEGVTTCVLRKLEIFRNTKVRSIQRNLERHKNAGLVF